MSGATTTRRLTYDDYLGFPEDGRRHELIDGEHFVAPAPLPLHQWLVARLTAALVDHFDRHPGGLVLPAPTDLVLSRHDVVQPDLLAMAAARAGTVVDRNVQGPPDLAIEVLSPSTRRLDRGRKRALYERAGVREYWLVDPAAETVTVHRRAGGGFDEVATLARAGREPLTTPLLPGLAIDLDRLFGKPSLLR
jgi:Uma2 family endonuclease